jgi:hypothetical protein
MIQLIKNPQKSYPFCIYNALEREQKYHWTHYMYVQTNTNGIVTTHHNLTCINPLCYPLAFVNRQNWYFYIRKFVFINFKSNETYINYYVWKGHRNLNIIFLSRYRIHYKYSNIIHFHICIYRYNLFNVFYFQLLSKIFCLLLTMELQTDDWKYIIPEIVKNVQ